MANVTFEPGQVIFEQGQPGDFMYVVKSGEIELKINGNTVDVLGDGDMFGEMALIDQEPRSGSAVAKTACELIRMDQEAFKTMIKHTPSFALKAMSLMAKRLRKRSG